MAVVMVAVVVTTVLEAEFQEATCPIALNHQSGRLFSVTQPSAVVMAKKLKSLHPSELR